MKFIPTRLSQEERALQLEVRDFLLAEIGEPGRRPGLGMLGARDEEFSKRLADKGWIGLSLPADYGGRDGSAVERFIVAEELLAAGAPVSAHWVADRQTAPMILNHGSEFLKDKFLRDIASGRVFFSLGMSEPEAGSDLANVQTTAKMVEGGFILSGRKIWTSGAEKNGYCTVLCRTSSEEARHAGLSQLIVDLSSAGVRVEPIRLLDGSEEFCEVSFEDVFVPEEMLLGGLGDGWDQVISELGYERAGPDRLLSALPLLDAYLSDPARGDSDPVARELLGSLVGRTWALRQMLLSVARMIDSGATPVIEAAIGKDLGTTLEQDMVDVIRRLVDAPPAPGASSRTADLLAEAVLLSPSWTIRGGTTEVLRTMVGRAVGQESPLNTGRWFNDGRPERGSLHVEMTRLLSDWFPLHASGDPDVEHKEFIEPYRQLDEMGITLLGVPESHGGAGGQFSDLGTAARLIGRFAAPVPVIENALAAWVLAESGLPLVHGTLTVADGVLGTAKPRPDFDSFLTAPTVRIPWAPVADHVVLFVRKPVGLTLLLVSSSELDLSVCTDLAGHRMAEISLESIGAVSKSLEIDSADLAMEALARGALLRCSAMVGCMETATQLSIDYAEQRQQFGRRIGAFQAVQHHLATAAGESLLSGIGVEAAILSHEVSRSTWYAGLAKGVACRSATRVAAAVHQVHGAMGMTAEYPLQRFTRRLWAWRDEFGSERRWASDIGREVMDCAEPGSVWRRISDVSDNANWR